MTHIKLDAIDSTNDFLKGLSSQEKLNDFTIVSTENQTNGKGQMGNVWHSEIGKNIIMSVLVNNFTKHANEIFNLNIIFSVAVLQSLYELKIPNLNIKWPNDIMADSKKIGGILIENSFKSDQSIVSVIGLGLNVNQTNFYNLPRASSLKAICKTDFDKDKLLLLIIEKLKYNIDLFKKNPTKIKSFYIEKLFKKGVTIDFKEKNNSLFAGMIVGVSVLGKIQIQLKDETVREFEIKEIEMIY